MRSRISLELAHQSIAGLNPKLVLAGSSQGKAAFARTHRIVEVSDDWFSSSPAFTDVSLPPEPFAGEREICRQTLTSGSTGEPKVVDKTPLAITDATSSQALCRLTANCFWPGWASPPRSASR